MQNTRKAVLLALLLTVGLLLVPFTAISYASVTPNGSEGKTSLVLEEESDGVADEVSQASHRLIIQLTSPSLAEMSASTGRSRLANGRLDVNSATARQYIAKLRAEQDTFVTAMRQALPNAMVSTHTNENGESVQQMYQVVFNGVAIDPGTTDLAHAERLLLRIPGVKMVYADGANQPHMYASLPLINAPDLWANQSIGGRGNAGAGIKLASMDGGVHKDAPMFNGTGYSYPPGYPLGDTRNTNKKIIVSRAYFRPWDPPAPGDENPWPGVAGTSHGVHTAGIAAGNYITAANYAGYITPISGVAPKAWVMSYRVFYESVRGDGSFYNAEGIAALEDIVKDGADVVNNSWGGGPSSMGGRFDALDTALRNAVSAGVFVSMSAGNSGPGMTTTDHPSDDYIIVAASSTSGTLTTGHITVTGATSPTMVGRPLALSSFGANLNLASRYSYTYVSSAVILTGTNVLGCDPWPAGTFDIPGKTAVAAVIARGTCEFDNKVYYAQQAGAEIVVVYNSVAGGEGLISMGAGSGSDKVPPAGEEITIPSFFVPRSVGLAMRDWYQMNGTNSQFTMDTFGYQVGNTADVIIGFSSRGPGVGNVLKPDIAAPGVNILSQGYTTYATGEARHLGYGQVSGTSMAAPHVAGAAALLQQAHPSWTPAEIKSALMSTSKYMDIWTHDGRPAQPLDMGAGRLDLKRAADPGVILDPPSLGFGQVPVGSVKSMVVTVRNITNASETYALSTLYTGAGFTATTTLPGFTVTPASVTLAPGASANVVVRFDSSTGHAGDNQGYLIMDGSTHHAHMPLWARVTNPGAKTDILIIDNDSSSWWGFGDYLPYYTDALQSLGYSYTVLDVDAMVSTANFDSRFLNPSELAGYKAILYYTGDNFTWNGFRPYALPLSEDDMYALNEYAANGGTIIAMGQDLSTVLLSDGPDPEFFYGFTLGGSWLTDTVTSQMTMTVRISSTNALPLAGTNLDISWGPADGADNQLYVDEIESAAYITVNMPGSVVDPSFQAVLQHRSASNLDKGTVAMVHREQPTLERPGVTFAGSTFYATFGLEGVNNMPGFTTREQLLRRVLNWAWDNPQVEIEVAPSGAGRLFVANFTSNVAGVRPVSYRWNFGDGTAFTAPSSSSTATHTYTFCSAETTAWVEVTDSLGNRTVNKVTGFCALNQPYKLFVPIFIK